MTTLALQPWTSTADGQAGTGAGYLTNGGSIQLGGYFGTANGWFGAQNVTIAPGATISDFRLSGDRVSAAGTADLKFQFIKAVNPTYPTSNSDYDSRTLTTAAVTASYSGTGAWTSANCAAPAQEVIDQPGWSSGNTQFFMVRDNNSNANHGAFENRIQLRAFDGGSNIPTLTWTYSSSLQAALPPGSVAFSGVAASTRKAAGLPVATVALPGIAPAARKTVAAAVGQLTIGGVAPASIHRSPLLVGITAFAGVAAACIHRTTLAVGLVACGGITVTSRHVIALTIGTVAIAGIPATAMAFASPPAGIWLIEGKTPLARKVTALPIGTLALSGRAPSVQHLAGLAIGSFALAGVAFRTQAIVPLPVGGLHFLGIELTVAGEFVQTAHIEGCVRIYATISGCIEVDPTIGGRVCSAPTIAGSVEIEP